MRNTILHTYSIAMYTTYAYNHQHKHKHTHTHKVFFSFIFHFSVHFHSLWFFKQILICNALVYIFTIRAYTFVRYHDFNGLYCTKFLKVLNRCLADVTNEPSLIGSIQNCIHYKVNEMSVLPPSLIIPHQIRTNTHTYTYTYAFINGWRHNAVTACYMQHNH